MALPTQIKDLKVSFTDGASLGAWVSKLADDIVSGKITGFELSTVKFEGQISGTLYIPTPQNLTIAIEDEPQ